MMGFRANVLCIQSLHITSIYMCRVYTWQVRTLYVQSLYITGEKSICAESPFYTLLPWSDVTTGQRPHTWLPPVLAFSLQNYEINSCLYEVLRLKWFILRTQHELIQSTNILSKKKKEVKGRSLWILWEKGGDEGRREGQSIFLIFHYIEEGSVLTLKWDQGRNSQLQTGVYSVIHSLWCFFWCSFSHSNCLSSPPEHPESHTWG